MKIPTSIRSVLGPFYSALFRLPKIARELSYYPELPHKSFLRQYLDLLRIRILENRVEEFYKAYGFDCISLPSKGYVDEACFWRQIIPLNYREKVNNANILRDKYLFDIVMSAVDVPTAPVIGHAVAGHFYFAHTEVSYDDWVERITAVQGEKFVKDAVSCCARGVRKIGSTWPLQEADFISGKFIVQKAVHNCEEINKLQPRSVNTLRIVTVENQKTGEIELLSPGGLRIGGGGDVDNWAAGGLFVGIDEDGKLLKWGFYKPGKHDPLKADHQPQTGVSFEGYQIPHYAEAIALVKRAHLAVHGVVTIGWDVAITPEGPVLIEGNDDWEITLMQMVGGGGGIVLSNWGF